MRDKTRIKEEILHLEKNLGQENNKETVPMSRRCHPDLDRMVLLDLVRLTECQRLMGVLQWEQ